MLKRSLGCERSFNENALRGQVSSGELTPGQMPVLWFFGPRGRDLSDGCSACRRIALSHPGSDERQELVAVLYRIRQWFKPLEKQRAYTKIIVT